MERKLNFEFVRQVAEKAGFSFTRLAEDVGVSTESVSKWLQGEATPRPGMAIKLGRVLEITYEQMFGVRSRDNEPQVAFRLTQNRKPTEDHLERGRELGKLYEELVPYLPFSKFESPTRLKNPENQDKYLNELCRSIRTEMGLDETEPVSLLSIFTHLSRKLQAVVVPVFWGHRKGQAELAVHIYSPRTKTTWIPFNLDTKLWDARFWLAHEMAHAFTFDVITDEMAAEDFSDAFAGTLVFPGVVAQKAYLETAAVKTKKAKTEIFRAYASQMHISPICVAKQIDRYAKSHNLPSVEAEYPGLYPALSFAAKAEKTVAQELFGDEEPSVGQLIEVATTIFKSPFFGALSKHLKENGGNPAFIQSLLDSSLVDAQSINCELA